MSGGAGYSSLADYWDQYYGLPSGTLYNLAGAESSFNPDAASGTGPQGIAEQTLGFQQQFNPSLTSVDLNPSDQLQYAGEELQPYAASGNLGGGLAAYTQGATGGAGMSFSPQYLAEANEGNPYAQNLETIAEGGTPSTSSYVQNYGGEGGTSVDTVEPSASSAPAVQAANNTIAGATSSVSAWWGTILGDIENFAERGAVLVLAGAIAIIAIIALIKHQSPGTVVKQGARHVGSAALRGAAMLAE